MAQQTKKSQSSAAATNFNKAKLSAISGGSATNKATAAKYEKDFNNFVSQGTKAVEQAIANSAEEAKKVQEKVLEFSREGAERLAESVDAAAKNFSDVVEIGKENFEAVVESANIASKIAKEIGQEISEFSNNIVSENLKAFEDFLACKTVNDFFNLQSNLIKNNVDAYFNQALKISEMSMEFSKAAEPVSERVAVTTEKLSKTITA